MIDKMKELQSKMFNEGVTDIYVAKEEVAELGRAGLIEIAGEPDAAGLLCVKISTKGAELLDSTPSDFPVKEAVVKQTVEVDDLEVEEDGSVDHPYGWKSYSIDIDSEGIHKFLGLNYQDLKI